MINSKKRYLICVIVVNISDSITVIKRIKKYIDYLQILKLNEASLIIRRA